MLIGELTYAQPITDRIMLRIVGRTVSLQCKCTDSGLRPNLFVQNFALMFYFIKFLRRNTRDHFYGPLNAYVYTNEDDTRAFINLRMNVTGVRPYAALTTDDNEIIPSRATRMSADRFDNELNVKLKYMIFKYVWQNIDDENVVQQQRLNKELFAHHLSDMHEDFCKFIQYTCSLCFVF
ncbi:hypothetical protein FB192DRAFT_1273576 [Mucor lusitanicus]|uniref:Uncharacterized protein n=1 Tax=Mucor circinelloides f. lusitanicus TaxID=29924 RepID=A0A8H4F735_MUCCL|nr:hypothetical protein FB192DRAFT_1273576 [Mucor lusitanicus]